MELALDFAVSPWVANKDYKVDGNFCYLCISWLHVLWTTLDLTSGFVQVLENLESPGILSWHFLGLESPGKRPLVLESSGNLLNSAKKIWSVWQAVRRINIEILRLLGLMWTLVPLKNQTESWKVLEICLWKRVRTLYSHSASPSGGMLF